GHRDAYRGFADSIKVGNLEFQNCDIEVYEGRNIVGEEGLIGSDVFAHFLVDIDFPDEKLKLSELPKRPGDAGQKLALESKESDEDSPNENKAEEKSGESKPSEEGKAEENKAADTKKVEAKEVQKEAKGASPSGPQDSYIAPEMQSYTRFFRFGHD